MRLALCCVASLCPSVASAQCNVTIIESQSINSGHDMDVEWQAVATTMGLPSTIAGQTTLDSTAYYSTTSVLVVSSGVIDLSAARVANIQGYLQQGGAVYLQGEYQTTYTTNQAFAGIAAAFGGSFTWSATVAGALHPVNVTGVLATTPNAVPSLGYFWYGAAGAGDSTITPFLSSGGNDLGWIFDSSLSGPMILTTDQDWIRATTSPELCINILTKLCGGGPVIGVNYCGPALPNSTGLPATIVANGSTSAAANNVALTADQLPPGQFGYFLASRTQGFFPPPGSQGILCLSGDIGRYNQAANVIQGPTGSIAIDLAAIPVNPPRAVLPGDTWNFQCWFRDSNPGPTSNFTDGVSLTFQ